MVSALVIKIKLLSKTINATGIAISLSVKAIAQKLADSFAKAKSIPRYKSKYELHHIVAQTAIKAAKARNILHKVRIDINSTENTVYLKTGLHRRIHTNEYYNLVNWIIEKAYNAGYSFYDRKNRVIKSLNAIKDLLLHARDLAPF